MIRRDCIWHNRSRLYYTVYGKGSGNLLTFHGYGQNGKVFSVFEQAFPDHTIYAFDLFGFGQSKWDEEAEVIDPAIWKALMSDFIDKEEIDKFSMAGFSLGAKPLLLAFEQFYLKIDHVFLIAPDGIAVSCWYNAVTRYTIPKACFRFIITHPMPFFRLLHALQTMRLMDVGTRKFLGSQMDSVQKRQKVYDVWMYYRGIGPSVALIAALALAATTSFTFFLGSKDRIFGRKAIDPLLSKLPNAKVVELDGGHAGLVEKTAQWLVAERD